MEAIATGRERLGASEEGSAVPAIGAAIRPTRVLGSKMEGLPRGGGMVSESLTVRRAGESLSGEQGAASLGSRMHGKFIWSNMELCDCFSPGRKRTNSKETQEELKQWRINLELPIR